MTPAISEQPPVAVALVGADGTIERATSLFLDCCGSADAFLAHYRSEIETVLEGEVAESTATLDRTTLEIAAVIDSDGARYALLTIARPAGESAGDSAAPLLNQAIDVSPAIVWLKDLDGRYLRVNGKYVEQLKTPAERVCGKTDAELKPGESIERLRLRRDDQAASEPLELEYTVAAGDDRPAFAVLRFALRDADRKPTAVCGVAATLGRANVARSECARLMRLEGWSRSDEPAVRAELIAEWGLTPAGAWEADGDGSQRPTSEPKAGEGDGDQFAAMAAELDAALETSARLDRELAEERRQVMVLREASVLSSRRAQELFRTVTTERARSAELEESLARAEARTAELERERDNEKTRADRAQDSVADAVAQEQEAAEALRAELEGAREELERLRNSVSEAPTLEQLEAERAQAHEAKLAAEQAQAEVATTTAALAKERRSVETLRAELRAAEEEVGRARRAASEAVAQAPTHDELEQERRRAERANAALAAARARAELAEAEAKSSLAQARSELRRAHEDAAAVSEALNAEKQRAASLRAELTEVRDELDAARRALAERPGSEELERERARADQAEATAKHAEEMVKQAEATARKAEGTARKAEGTARKAEAAAQQSEDAAEQARREASELSERIAELEQTHMASAKSSATAQQKTVEKLRRELAAARDELERARSRADQAEAEAELERARVEETEATAERERARAAETEANAKRAQREASALTARIGELERAAAAVDNQGPAPAELQGPTPAELEEARAEAAAAVAATEAERQTVEALRAELSSVRAELEQLQSELSLVNRSHEEASGADDGDADGQPGPAPVDEMVPGSLVWEPASQRAFAAALTEATEWRTVLKQAVKVIGAEGKWDAVVAWFPEQRRAVMKCAAMWMDNSTSSSTFETQVWQHRQKLPSDTASCSPSAKSLAALEDGEDSLLKAAAAEGMGCVVSLPISDGTQLLGMVQLLSGQTAPPSPALMLSLEGVALQLAAIARLLNSSNTPQWRVGRL